MRKLVLAAAISALMSGSALAENIGVSMALFDDNFLTVLRKAIQDSAAKQNVKLQIEDAQNDVGKQLNQIQNFAAAKVDAIIVNPVDTDATAAMSKAAADAGIPLVFVNRMPVNLGKLPSNQAFVGSNEAESSTLETREICRALKDKGKKEARIVVMMGELSNQAARQRTKDIEDVIATSDCSFMKIVEKQAANWSRTQAADLMTNWLSAGLKFDAFIPNNDEMAIGGIGSIKTAGLSTKEILVGGIDGTKDGLAAMQAGDLAVTVFQNAAGQGQGAVETALKLAKGSKVDSTVWVPFELVTPANLKNYLSKN